MWSWGCGTGFYGWGIVSVAMTKAKVVGRLWNGGGPNMVRLGRRGDSDATVGLDRGGLGRLRFGEGAGSWWQKEWVVAAGARG